MQCVQIAISFFLLFFKSLLENTQKMLEACEAFVTYESGIILDRQGFEVNDDPVWILGQKYDTRTSEFLLGLENELYQITSFFLT